MLMRAVGDDQAHVRGQLRQIGDRLGHQPPRDRGQRPQPQHHARLGAKGPHAAQAAFKRRQAGQGEAVKELALRGQRDAGPAALQQGGADDILKLGQGAGNGRLGQQQPLGRALEALAAGDFDKGLQMPYLDAPVHRQILIKFDN